MKLAPQNKSTFLISISLSISLLATLLIGALLPTVLFAKTKNSIIENSVVKIHAVISEANYDDPWNLYANNPVSGSGSVIVGNRILTNAHVVADAKFIQVSKRSSPKKYTAKVEFVAHGYDLAILKLDDEEFFKGLKPIKFGKLPNLRDKLVTLGYPIGGNILSITEGVVSRIEHRVYVHANSYYLACQTDASINPGNSGGPVLKNNKMVGVAFQGGAGDNLGYFIPISIVEHFLTDVKDGDFDGSPALGIEYETMENTSLRDFYGLNKKQTGIRIKWIAPDSSAEGQLKQNDVILKIDAYDINNDGTIEFRADERTSLNYIFDNHYIGDKVSLNIIRDKKQLKINLKLKGRQKIKKNVAKISFDTPPSYYVYGGLIFQPLTENYLKTWGRYWRAKAPNKLMQLFYKRAEKNIDDYPILTKVLAHDINAGYEKINNLIVDKINGKKVKSFKQMVQLIQNNKDKYLVIESPLSEEIVLKTKDVNSYQADILKTYLINKTMSDDVESFLSKN